MLALEVVGFYRCWERALLGFAGYALSFTISISASGLHVPNNSKSFPVENSFLYLSWTGQCNWQSTVSMRFHLNVGSSLLWPQIAVITSDSCLGIHGIDYKGLEPRSTVT